MNLVARSVILKDLAPSIRNGSAKLFAKHIIPSDQQCTANPTMMDFWVQREWYRIEQANQAHWMSDAGVRAAAIRFLVEKVLRKDPRDTIKKDFYSNKLNGLFVYYYNGSPYEALKEAGYDFHPWEMRWTPRGVFDSKENRVAATRWLVETLGKDPRNITKEDFISNRLVGLLNKYYNHSPYNALKEAGYDFHPWEMSKTPSWFYKSKENRIAATKWLVEKLGKEPREMLCEDFRSYLPGLMRQHYNSSAYLALLEAGLVTKADEAYMRSNRHNRGDSK